MSERSDQLKKLLLAMSRHSDLIAEAYDGMVSTGDKTRNAALDALHELRILKPIEEHAYMLNPRLRSFFSENLASYSAFQSLVRVSETMKQAQAQWDEIRLLRLNKGKRDYHRLLSSFEESISEIAFSIDENLRMLQALLATQYGNVADLGTKKRQNIYYAKQIKGFLRDVQAIDHFVDGVREGSIAIGLLDIGQLVMQRLGSRCLQWTTHIREAQGVISKRLFEAQRMEADLRRIARYSLWLTQHKTAAGWDLPLDEIAHAGLFKPEQIKIRPQPDFADVDTLIQESLNAAIAKLPPVEAPKLLAKHEKPQILLSEAEEFVTEAWDPVTEAIESVVASLLGGSPEISLRDWKLRERSLDAYDDEGWMMYAGQQLKGTGMMLRYVDLPLIEAFQINEHFQDIFVSV